MLEGLLHMEDGDQLVPFVRYTSMEVLQLMCGRTKWGSPTKFTKVRVGGRVIH